MKRTLRFRTTANRLSLFPRCVVRCTANSLFFSHKSRVTKAIKQGFSVLLERSKQKVSGSKQILGVHAISV